MPLHPVLDYVSLCPRVQVCIQSPIEMLFSPFKAEFLRLVGARRRSQLDTSPEVVAETALQAFQDKGSAERAYTCWENARKCLTVRTPPSDRWVDIVNH
jgi:hypothetical protein